MGNYALSTLRRIYTQLQTTGAWPANFNVVQNTAGTWDSTGVKFISAAENAVKLSPVMPKTANPLLTGTRATRPGILGRKSASWELGVPIIPNGSAGVVPDTDHLWQNVFGQPATIVAATSATYNFLDTGFIPFSLFDFYHGVSTLTQRMIWGSFVDEVTLTYNGNIFTGSFRGFGGYRLDSNNFSSEDTIAKAGLTSYPLEPGSAVSNGSIIPGFYATATFDSQSIEAKVRALTIRIQTGARPIGDVIQTAYIIGAVGARRQVSVSLTVVDDDSAALNDLKQKAKSNATISGTVTLGQTAGSKVAITMQGIQLITEDYDDQGAEVNATFPESLAHASAVGNVDEISLAFL